MQPSSGVQRARERETGAESGGAASPDRPAPTGQSRSRPTQRHRRRARPGAWEAAYLDALSRGHTKAAAAGMAGVSERTVYKRANQDPDFAMHAEMAYNRGGAVLMDIAMMRIADRADGSCKLLIHLLSARGITPKRVADEQRGPQGAAIESGATISIDSLSFETRRRLLEELEAIHREAQSADRR